MAISSAEFRQLLKNVQSLTAQSRAAGNTNTDIRGQLEALLPQLREAASEGYTDATAAIDEVNSYTRLITQKSETPAASTLSTTASQSAQDDAPQGPTAAPQQEVSANGRIVTKPDTTAPSNADQPATTDSGGGDKNTNPPTVTTAQSQAISPTSGPVPILKVGHYDSNGRQLTQEEIWANTGKPVIKAGVAAAGDDSGVTNKVQQSKDLNQNFNAAETITPQPNILDNFYSYTYTASVYLMTPDQYQKLLASKKKSINGYQLLFQSGAHQLTLVAPAVHRILVPVVTSYMTQKHKQPLRKQRQFRMLGETLSSLTIFISTQLLLIMRFQGRILVQRTW